jgi:hypothetical protein
MLRLMVFCLLIGHSGTAIAQEQTARMADCLVQSTTGADRVGLARWIGFAIAAHPSVASRVAIPQISIDETDNEIGTLMTDLLTVHCAAQTRAALEADGEIAFENAFAVLGDVAMQEAMMSDAVNARIMGFMRYVDENKLRSLFD